MPDEQTESLSLVAAYPFAVQHGLSQQAAEIRSMAIDGFKNKSSVRRGYMLKLLQENGLLSEFIEKHWAFGKTAAGEAKQRRYTKLWERHQRLLKGADTPEDPESDSDEPTSEQGFALESDLRDYLAYNLGVIEPGLHLFEDGQHNGVEYPVEAGFIDILAKDQNGTFVVIELKLSEGRNKTIGQILYYMGWVDEHLGQGPCRGIIIARDISDDLRVAATRVPGISLYRYRVSMTVEPVPFQTGEA